MVTGTVGWCDGFCNVPATLSMITAQYGLVMINILRPWSRISASALARVSRPRIGASARAREVAVERPSPSG
jgi:hypothetical protein